MYLNLINLIWITKQTEKHLQYFIFSAKIAKYGCVLFGLKIPSTQCEERQHFQSGTDLLLYSQHTKHISYTE